MKLKITRNLGRGLPPFTEGQVVAVGKDLDEAQAEALMSRGLAEAMESRSVKAVAKSPTLTAPAKPLRSPPLNVKAADTPVKEPAAEATTETTTPDKEL